MTNGNDRLWWCLCLALLLHWLFFRLHVPEKLTGSTTAQQAEKPIEIAPYPSRDKPIVRTSKAKEEPEAKDKKAEYAGEFRNRVSKEMRSPLHGRFHEGRILSAPPAEPNTEGEKGGAHQPSMSDLMALGSTPNELAKEIQEGNETILNTDPVRYASFINRIADEIYDPWVQNARAAVKEIYISGQRLEASTYITKLQVEMDRDGKIIAITTLQSSGVGELDEATKKAFWDTEPFPNPPEGLFDKDGEVKFVYEFHFEWKTSSFNIVPWTI